METIVKIKWDSSEDQDWLCADNIGIALSSHCKNTKFEVEDIKEMTGSEAIFGFCAWLTGRKEKTVMSAKHNSATIVDLIKEFCETNKLPDPRDEWTDYLTHPKN